MSRVAIVGGGISGISIARILTDKGGHEITVFDKKPHLGGLISCERVNGALFHKVGGHVFNTKNEEVFDWFWSFFDRDKEFLKAKRNAKIFIYRNYVGYPIENYLYQLPDSVAEKSVVELISKYNSRVEESDNFDAFLKANFGKTLYEEYFKPYNTKLWNMDLKKVPLDWLAGIYQCLM